MVREKRNSKIFNQQGFTLIELMVVAVILAIIAAIAVPIYNGYKKEAQAQEAYQTLAQWGDVIIGRMVKAKETGQTSFTVPSTPNDGTYFNYSASSTSGTVGSAVTLTATGKTGMAVEGENLKLTVNLTGNTPSKTFSGDLY